MDANLEKAIDELKLKIAPIKQEFKGLVTFVFYEHRQDNSLRPKR